MAWPAELLFPLPPGAVLLGGAERKAAQAAIVKGHYTHSVPSGKSHYFAVGDALVVYALPANMHAARFLTGHGDWAVWELARLWAPDGHEPNLLTRAIAEATRRLAALERPAACLSYADPNAGHSGGVYRAASWVYLGQCEDARAWQRDGQVVPRRKFHSGHSFLRKPEIVALGWTETTLAGKHRFARPLTRAARRALAERFPGAS